MRYANTLLGMCCAMALTASPVLAADTSNMNTNAKSGANTTTGATANPGGSVSRADDGEWIRLSGTVRSVSDDEFTLDYGKDRITVETDDFRSDALRSLKQGDRVMVSGRIDDGFFSSKSIVASTVRVEGSQETLSSNHAAMNDSRSAFPEAPGNVSRMEDGDWISLTGKVSKMDDDEFTIQTGSQSVAVDASDVDGFDRKGLRVGDRVSVSGEVDEGGLFTDREIETNSVVILSSNAPGSRGGSS